MNDSGVRYWWAYGYRTAEKAQDALWDSMAEGKVSEGEAPKVEAYKTETGNRYGITLTQ